MESSDLSKWMEKNGVFDEHFLSVLESHNVSTLEQLKVLKVGQFDKLIRMARTEKSAKGKDQKAHDEMLVKLEKAWRNMK